MYVRRYCVSFIQLPNYLMEARGQEKYLLGSITHAQHAIRKMPIISKSAMSAKKSLVVPSFQKLLQNVIPIQT